MADPQSVALNQWDVAGGTIRVRYSTLLFSGPQESMQNRGRHFEPVVGWADEVARVSSITATKVA